MKKKTTEQFVLEAIEKHGDKYDYSKVVYTTTNSKIVVTCKVHGDFEQTPKQHLKGTYPCNACSLLHKKTLFSDTRETFIEKAQNIHKDNNGLPLFDYSKVVYINSQINVSIICKNQNHGTFQQAPSSHLQRHGCPKCSKNYKPTKEEFIKFAEAIHSYENATPKYDYTTIDYKNAKKKISILCKRCNYKFEQTPDSHIQGNGCPTCASKQRGENQRLDLNEFVMRSQKIHIDKSELPLYDYSLVKYTLSNVPVIIKCKMHGEFNQTPNAHLTGSGCKLCGISKSGKSKLMSNDEFIEKSKKCHGNIYDYSLCNYISSKDKVVIICEIHGQFKQVAQYHYSGNGCPMCINKTEGKLYEKIVPLYPTMIPQFKQDWCMKKSYLPFDFVIPELKIIIELDGPQHFQQISNWSSPAEQFENDKYKEKCANDNGYSVIRLLQEDVFYDTYDWVKELCEIIEEIRNGDELTNVYICKNGEYDSY